jgi:hypothetical protein
MAQNNQKIFFYALFWPFGIPKGPRVGTIYGLISKLKIKHLTKSLASSYEEKWSKTTRKQDFMLFLDILGHLGNLKWIMKDTQKPASRQDV